MITPKSRIPFLQGQSEAMAFNIADLYAALLKELADLKIKR